MEEAIMDDTDPTQKAQGIAIKKKSIGVFSQLPLLPILSISSNAIFSLKLTPHGKEFAIIIPQAHSFGNTVARGHHLCVPLCCQNCKL
jgi:hypothetical protein